MSTIHFDLVTPEKALIAEDVEMVVIPGKLGYFGALPEHAPFATSLKPGIIGIYVHGKIKDRLFVRGGFADITPQQCSVLADEAISLNQLDIEKLKKDLQEMESDKEEAATTQASLLREMVEAIKDADVICPAKI